MCTTCGCGGGHTHTHVHTDENGIETITVHEHHHDHDHGGHHDHDHAPQHSHLPGTTAARAVMVEEDILSRNDKIAAENRAAFARGRVLALNLVSSPGSGKTELLAAVLRRLAGEIPTAVIEGDQETTNDAARIMATGTRAVQINTGKGCHLDAQMVKDALARLPLEEASILFIENVGNLVCPAEFDLGEAHKVAVLSVTEGEDKPLKYPDMFRASDIVVINKVDLLPYLNFDIQKAEEFILRVNPSAKIFRTSATNGEGLERLIAWLKASLLAAAI